MDKLKEILNKVISIIVGFFTCNDMKALYWYSFSQFIASGLDIILQQLTSWDPDNMLTIFVGLVISRITKKLNSKN